MAQVETGKESRQGEKGKPVLYVLVAAVILAIVAGAGMLTWQNGASPPDRSSQSQDAARATAANPTATPAEQKAN